MAVISVQVLYLFFFIYHLILSSTLPPILFNISIHDLSLSPLLNFCFFVFFLFRNSHFQNPCSFLLLHLCHPHISFVKKISMPSFIAFSLCLLSHHVMQTSSTASVRTSRFAPLFLCLSFSSLKVYKRFWSRNFIDLNASFTIVLLSSSVYGTSPGCHVSFLSEGLAAACPVSVGGLPCLRFL